MSLVLSRLDYGCATLAGLPSQLLDRLQSVKNKNDVIANKLRIYCDIRKRFVRMSCELLLIANRSRSCLKLLSPSGFATGFRQPQRLCDCSATIWRCTLSHKFLEHVQKLWRLDARQLRTHANVSRQFGNSLANFVAISRELSQSNESGPLATV